VKVSAFPIWVLILLIFACSACNNFSERVDRLAFESFGGTLLSSPKEVTVKEIHLDNGKLLGKKVIVQAAVVEVGEHATHLVVADSAARLLIVTTMLTNAPELLEKANPKSFRVLGTVERGKKGLPYVLAKAITPVTAAGG
jgi:hypothetical protein